MSGYVPGYLVPYNLDTSFWPNQSSDIAEISVSSVNGVPVLIPNGVRPTGRTSPYYGSAGLNGGTAPRHWWVPGNVSNIGGQNYTTNDVNNNYRDEIAAAYIKYFNRFAGPVAMENWVYTWLFGGGQSFYGTIDNMIRQGGESSGEINSARSTPYWIPYTYYAPQIGCTDSTASNYLGPAAQLYQRLFTSPVIISRPSSCTFITASISASPTEILSGSSSTLSWETSNATNVSINNGVGNVNSSGTRSVNPTSTTTYTITASNLSNSNATKTSSTTITVRNNPTASISVSPSTIESGGSSTLSWSTTNATNVSITNYGNNLGSSGSVTVNPTSTTTYTLNVTGYFNTSASSSATLTVLPPKVPYVKVNEDWRRVKQIYVNDNGAWKLCKSAYVNVNGTWTQIFK